MRTTTTIGVAIEDGDRTRLDHLAQVFGGGNRSAFLRVAMNVMEQLELVQELGKSQAYGAQQLVVAGRTIEDIPEIVEKALANPDPGAVAQAKLIVADLSKRYAASLCEPPAEDPALSTVVKETIDETNGL